MTPPFPRPLPPVGDVIDRLAEESLVQPAPLAVLDRCRDIARETFSGAASVSIAVLDMRRRPVTVASSDDLARTGDDLQYRLGEGPCLDAVWTADVVHSPDLATESRWPAASPSTRPSPTPMPSTGRTWKPGWSAGT